MKKSVLIIVFVILLTSLVTAGQLQVTNEHPFLINGKWISAEQLKVGDELTTLDGSNIIITNIKDILSDKPVEVYNLEANPYNNFIVSQGVVVHNSDDIENTGLTYRDENLDNKAGELLYPNGMCQEGKIYTIDSEASIFDQEGRGLTNVEVNERVEGVRKFIEYDKESKTLTYIDNLGKEHKLENVERYSYSGDYFEKGEEGVTNTLIVTRKGNTYYIDFANNGEPILIETPEKGIVGQLPNSIYDSEKKVLVYSEGNQIREAEVIAGDEVSKYNKIGSVNDGRRKFDIYLDEKGSYRAVLTDDNEALLSIEKKLRGSWEIVYDNNGVVIMKSRFGEFKDQFRIYIDGVASVNELLAYDPFKKIIVHRSRQTGELFYRTLPSQYGKHLTSDVKLSLINFDGRVVEWDGNRLLYPPMEPPKNPGKCVSEATGPFQKKETADFVYERYTEEKPIGTITGSNNPIQRRGLKRVASKARENIINPETKTMVLRDENGEIIATISTFSSDLSKSLSKELGFEVIDVGGSGVEEVGGIASKEGALSRQSMFELFLGGSEFVKSTNENAEYLIATTNSDHARAYRVILRGDKDNPVTMPLRDFLGDERFNVFIQQNNILTTAQLRERYPNEYEGWVREGLNTECTTWIMMGGEPLEAELTLLKIGGDEEPGLIEYLRGRLGR